MKKRRFLIIGLIFLLIGLDQITKLIVIKKFDNEINFGIFGINLIKNDGIAFSINSGNLRNIIMEIIIILLILRFLIVQINQMTPITWISLSMILAGGTSNLIDRIFRKRSYRFYKNRKICNI